MDSESEHTVQQALDKLLSKDDSALGSRMTTLVVAHRKYESSLYLCFFVQDGQGLTLVHSSRRFIDH